MYKNVLANDADMISQLKMQATVKQFTLNVTDIDKINIVSLQAVLEMSSYSADARSKSFSPLASSLVKNWLFKT